MGASVWIMRARARAFAAALRPDHVRAYWFRDVPNLGDLLAPAILRLAFGLTAVPVSSETRHKVLTVGSVLQHARSGDIVWGAGLNAPRAVDVHGVDVRCVRGPRTHAHLRGDAPTVFGDPASLMPLLYTPQPVRRYDVGLIPHYVDQDIVDVDDPAVQMIDVTATDWRRTIDRIVECDVIVSSSLHGIVVAEAYRIPAVWLHASDGVTGGRFKYDDYYEATGREVASPAFWRDGLVAAVSRAEAPPPIDTKRLFDAWERRG